MDGIIWKTTITAAIAALKLAARAIELEQAAYRVPIIDHTGRIAQ
jgi:hypothetical protein